TVTSSAAMPLLNQTVTFTATVTPAAGSGTPTGTVQFQIDGVNAGDPVPLSGGQASFSTATLPLGQHTITALYSGDGSFQVSSGCTSLTVIPPSSLSGFVFEDFNDDGQVDFREGGIAGVSIRLTGTDNLGNAVDLPQTTDAIGAYIFANLRPGSYYL